MALVPTSAACGARLSDAQRGRRRRPGVGAARAVLAADAGRGRGAVDHRAATAGGGAVGSPSGGGRGPRRRLGRHTVAGERDVAARRRRARRCRSTRSASADTEIVARQRVDDQRPDPRGRPDRRRRRPGLPRLHQQPGRRLRPHCTCFTTGDDRTDPGTNRGPRPSACRTRSSASSAGPRSWTPAPPPPSRAPTSP